MSKTGKARDLTLLLTCFCVGVSASGSTASCCVIPIIVVCKAHTLGSSEAWDRRISLLDRRHCGCRLIGCDESTLR